MKNKILVLFLCALVAIIATAIGLNTLNKESANTDKSSVSEFQGQKPKAIELTASFEIYTNGTKRIFSQSMYHNRSDDVFIENPDPSIVHVKKQGIRWSEFFETLPFSLTKDCLVTGTKQQFCNTETKKLNFVLNGISTPDVLNFEIKQGDKLVVTYGN